MDGLSLLHNVRGHHWEDLKAGWESLDGWGLEAIEHSFTYIVIDSGCWLGPQLAFFTRKLACDLSTWLLALPDSMVAGF